MARPIIIKGSFSVLYLKISLMTKGVRLTVEDFSLSFPQTFTFQAKSIPLGCSSSSSPRSPVGHTFIGDRKALQLLMSSGVGLFSREGRPNSKRFLQPPQMSSNFDIFSSQERDPSVADGPIHELSNVEERSNFDSEIQQPDQSDIAEYLAKVQMLDQRQATPPPRTARSQRLEDQEIIVVEEGAEVSSDVGGNESVILEHIEFVNDTHPENTPEWEEPRSREGRREEVEPSGVQSMQEVKYVINLVPESPPWVNDNMSNSTPYDIESSSFKLNPNRNSKNTCVDRTEPLHPDRPNKSCIEQPIRFQEEPPTPKLSKYSSLKGCDIKHILDKWNQELYPRLEGQYLDAPTNIAVIPPGRRASADFHLQMDTKFCHSGFEDPSSPTHSHRLPIAYTVEMETQTDIAGDELLHNQKYLTEEITQLRAKNIKLQEEIRAARLKEVELQGKSQRQTVEQSQQERRWGEESRKLSSKNRQLERQISQQNDTIRHFQERQESLEKKLHSTVSYQTLQSTPNDRSPTFFAGQFQSVKLNKLHTFGQEEHINPHEKCRREIEELQETIFDLKQQIAGLDIEVERRVRIISQALQQEVEEKAARDAHSLREELTRHKQVLQRLQENIKENQERNLARERDISQREKEVSRMYDELVKEWKEMQKKGEEQRKRHKIQIKASNFYSPKVAPKGRFDFDRPQHVPEKEDPPTNYYLSSRDLNPSFSTRNRSALPQRSMEVLNNHSVSYLPPDDSLSISFRRPARTNDTDRISASFTQMGQGQGQGELCAINSKIQRLRQEINRELCAFHP